MSRPPVSGLALWVSCSLSIQLPQFYQVAKKETAFQSGVLVLPLILSQIATSFTSGYLVSRYSCYRINMVVGYALWTVASGLFTTVTPETSSGLLVVYQLLTGLGCGQTTQIALVAIQAAVKRNEMAVATGARNYLRKMGSTLAVAATSVIINNIVKYARDPRRPFCADHTDQGQASEPGL